MVLSHLNQALLQGDMMTPPPEGENQVPGQGRGMAQAGSGLVLTSQGVFPAVTVATACAAVESWVSGRGLETDRGALISTLHTGTAEGIQPRSQQGPNMPAHARILHTRRGSGTPVSTHGACGRIRNLPRGDAAVFFPLCFGGGCGVSIRGPCCCSDPVWDSEQRKCT